MLKVVDKSISPLLCNFLGDSNRYSITELDRYQQYAVQKAVITLHRLNAYLAAFQAAHPYSRKKPEPINPIEVYCKQKQCTEREAVMALAPGYCCAVDELFGALDKTPMPAIDLPVNQPTKRRSPADRYSQPLAATYSYQVPHFRCVPKIVNVAGKDYKFSHRTFLTTPQGSVNGGIAHYQRDDSTGLEIQMPLRARVEYLYFDTADCSLIPGYSAAHRKLLYADKIEKMKPDGIVYLCEDLRIATELNGMIADSKRYTPGKYVATSWYGGNRLMKGIHLGALWGRKVVIIPAISRENYSKIFDLVDLAKKAGAISVRILPTPVLCHRPAGIASDVQNIINGADPWERFVINEMRVISDQESLILAAFDEWAIDEDGYRKWSIEHGLLYEPNEELSKPSKLLPMLSPSELSMRIGPSKVAQGVDIRAFGHQGHSTVIYGDTNSAKSMIGIGVALAKACGKEIWGLKAEAPHRVAIVDAETEADDFARRIQRNKAAFNVDSDLMDQFLRVTHLPSATSESPLNLTDPKFLMNLEYAIVEQKITTLVLDNLIWLLPGFRQKGHTLWVKFIPWMTRMEKDHGVSFILLHHSNQSEQAAGTRDIEAQCKNVIFVEGRATLMEEASPPKSVSAFADYFHRDGVLSRITFKNARLSLNWS